MRFALAFPFLVIAWVALILALMIGGQKTKQAVVRFAEDALVNPAKYPK